MKKQLLAAAVAATMTSVAMADLSITGNAKYEFKNIEDVNNSTTNTGHTEMNLKFTGTTGGTTAVVNTEWNGGDSAGSSSPHVEDMYLTTKIGDVALKMGDFASGTTGLAGEIDEGGRSTDKVSITTNLGDIALGYHTVPGDGSADAVTASMKVGDYTVSLKESANSYTAYGISGSVAGVGVRLEQKNSDTANSDVTFGNLTFSTGGVDLGYGWISADAASLVTESDSSIFAVEMATADGAKTDVDGVQQVSAKTSVSGNTITLKAGKLTHTAGHNDANFTQVDVKRALAGGTTLAVTYTNADTENIATSGTQTDTSTLEVDLSVKF